MRYTGLLGLVHGCLCEIPHSLCAFGIWSFCPVFLHEEQDEYDLSVARERYMAHLISSLRTLRVQGQHDDWTIVPKNNNSLCIPSLQ